MRSWLNSPARPRPTWRAERARLSNRGEVAISLRCPGLGRQGRLRGHGVFAALGKHLFDLSVRVGDDVYRH